MGWRSLDELLAWLAERPPAEAVRLSRLLADTKTAGALREYADRIVYDMTREATYKRVGEELALGRKQVMSAVERESARRSA
jgi:hypothetical protein